MNKNIDTIVGWAIIIILVASVIYLLLAAKPVVQLPELGAKGNYTLYIVTTWSQWRIDDFRQWMYYQSGVGLGGAMIVKPPAAQTLGITKMEFTSSKLNISKWAELAMSGEVSGFMTEGISYENATKLCKAGVFKPIESVYVVSVAQNLPQIFKGYTDDGKLCWVAMWFYANNVWFVNTRVAQRLNVSIPQSIEDLLNPQYAAVLLKGKDVLVWGSLDETPTIAMFDAILQRYGWEQGWVYIKYLVAISHMAASVPEARSEVAFSKTMMAVMDFGSAADGTALGKNLTIIVPRGLVTYSIGIAGIARNADAEATEGMSRLIGYMLTAAQNDVMLTRWRGEYPTNPTNNPSKFAVYYKQLVDNIYGKYNSTLASKLDPVVKTYLGVLFDSEVQSMLKNIVKALAKKYIEGSIDLNAYYSIINEMGKIPTFTDPRTNTPIKLDISTALELAKAINSGEITKDELQASMKKAELQHLQMIASGIGLTET
ncbi:MAG: extracellular solute-binding protein [Ignisphaera sp.]